MRRSIIVFTAIALLGILAVSACSGPKASTGGNPPPKADTGSETLAKEYEDFDPTSFDRSTEIDNEWMPLKPGTRFVYEGTTTENGESLHHLMEFTVTDLTKEIAGVRTVVAWIVDYQDDQLVEKEISFYAQDKDGNIWYLGEHPEEYEDGEFVKAPTWIHGLEDARAGLKMSAKPQLGSPSFSQGWAPAVDFMDRGQVTYLGLQVCVFLDCYEPVLLIDEFTLVEPNAYQLKYYARGVGNIRVGWRGEDALQEVLELVEFEQLSPGALAEVRAQALALELEKHAYEVSPDVYGNTSPAQ
jgi:hypothetical protein